VVIWLKEPLYYIFAPDIYNLLGVKASRDTEILLAHRVRGMPLERLIEETYSIRSCKAYHEAWVWATRVDCHVSDREGGRSMLSWEVRHYRAPREWVPERPLYITPLTRAAGELAPELLPDNVRPRDLPLSRYSAGYLYDVAREKQHTNGPAEGGASQGSLPE
jgi:hypothetical protein